MNYVLESLYAWTGSFVEAINRLTCDVTNLIFISFSVTSNSGDSDTTTISNSPVDSAEKAVLNFPQVLHEAASIFAFDDFQFLLLKIFVAIFLSNICLIYIAWYIYGTRITERFMSPSTSPEELKQGVLNLQLPTEHSQQYS